MNARRMGSEIDLGILGRTLRHVLRREGISHGGEATMPEFMGSAEQTAA